MNADGVADEGRVSTASVDEDYMNIDSNAFAVDKYVVALLQYKSLEELVLRGNAMVSEIKSLDSDMQMLVYENYNKFISATDTIRKMKHRVEVSAIKHWRQALFHSPALSSCSWPIAMAGDGIADGPAREEYCHYLDG